MTALVQPAPGWDVETWLNAPNPPDLASLRGRVVVALAFQMLCPGCVQMALPQLQRVESLFPRDQVVVLGLHTVFEHHEAMGIASLRAFAHEYRLGFPIGVDRPASDGGAPMTMRRYGMRGTPTLLLIDRAGGLRRQAFGHVEDISLGAAIASLLAEAPTSGCADGTCAL
ncbi:MAG: peroxiredoxin family protein [Elsteraceae bacterium]